MNADELNLDGVLALPEYQRLCTEQMVEMSAFHARQATARIRLALKLRQQQEEAK